MPSTSKTYRQLQPEDRVTLASLRQQGVGVPAIARMLKRSTSIVSRELQRNACEGSYTNAGAYRRCHKRSLSACPARKLDLNGVMFGVVRHCLSLLWSPKQIALTLGSIYPKGHPYRVSH